MSSDTTYKAQWGFLSESFTASSSRKDLFLLLFLTKTFPLLFTTSLYLVFIIMSFWWRCGELNPGPVCVHVASTFTSYILSYVSEDVNPLTVYILDVIIITRSSLPEWIKPFIFEFFWLFYF